MKTSNGLGRPRRQDRFLASEFCHASRTINRADGPDQDTYLVLGDFGWIGCHWRENEVGSTDRETLIRALAHGEFSKPIRIVVFNMPKAGPATRPRTSPTNCADTMSTSAKYGRDTRLNECQPPLSRF